MDKVHTITNEESTVSEFAPIPPAQFRERVASLGTTAFAEFVGTLWAETAASVTVAPPMVVASDADGREIRIRTVAAARLTEKTDGDAVDGADGVPADVVVVAAATRDVVEHLGGRGSNIWSKSDTPPDPKSKTEATDAWRAVYTVDDLRNRLLYELEPETGEQLCTDAIGMSLRSTEYPPVTMTQSGSDAGESTTDDSEPIGEDGESIGDDESTEGPTDAAERTYRSAMTGSSASSRMPDDTREPDETRNAGTSGSAATTRSSENIDGRDRQGGLDGWDFQRPVVIVAVIIVMLATISGAALLVTSDGEDFSNIGSIGDRSGTGDLEGVGDLGGIGDSNDGTDPSEPETDELVSSNETRMTDPPDVGTGEGGTVVEGASTPPHYYADGVGSNESAASVDAEETGAVTETIATRSTTLEPTCDRPPLLVVQIQMNALRQNDPKTNDGIQTTRRFASPGNRRTVGSLAQYVDLFETPTYAPMLSYDSVEYVPERVDGDVAEVRVVTRENGTVTARYTFRLRQISAEDGSITSGSTGYDGCWMTDGVAAAESAEAG